VDDNDPSLFAKTSDGSIDESFAYGKKDIPRLYVQIGEYRLGKIANSRLTQLEEENVAAYVQILDAEILRTQTYPASVLQILRSNFKLPTYRVM
jgi:hypothetical protein